jgi:hypothetical protein
METALQQYEAFDTGEDGPTAIIELPGVDDEMYWDDGGFLGIEGAADRVLLGILLAGCGAAILGTLAVGPLLAAVVRLYGRG